MKGALWRDLDLLFSLNQRYRSNLAGIVLLSVLAFAFDGLSIGMLVPLMANLQNADAAGTAAASFRWLAVLSAAIPEARRVYALLGIIVVAVAFKNGLTFLAVRSGHRLCSRMVTEIRSAMVGGFLSKGLDFHDRSKPAEQLDRVVRQTNDLEVLIRVSVEFITNTIALVMLAAILFALSWRLAVLAVGVGAVFMFCGLVYARSLSRLGTDAADAARAMSSGLYEMVGAIRLIKSSSTERRHVGELERDIEAAARASFRRTIMNFAIHPITDVAATSAMAAIFLVSLWLNGGDARRMLAQSLPFMFVLLRMVPLLKILNGQKAVIVTQLPYLESVAESLRSDPNPTIRDGDEPFPGILREIRLDGVTFRYQGRPKPALSSINLVIPAGKTTAIIGESGSGKSTLINLILRLYDPQEGAITIDGRPLDKLQLESYHGRIGSVAQDTFLFHRTVRINIGYGAAEPPSEERVIAAARRACAHDFIMELPDGYDTLVGNCGVRLSGGQRQRLALARAIVVDPEILIFDEATSALDAETERSIQEAFKEFGRGRTVIVIAHRPSTIRGADQVVVLKNGRIIEIRRPRPQAV